MRRQIALAAAGLAVLGTPVEASAQPRAALVTHDLAPRAGRAVVRFDLVGLRWRGEGVVRFRTRALNGGWRAWRVAEPREPYWTGPSDRIEWRASRTVRRLRGDFVVSPVVGVPVRSVSLTGSPAVIRRTAWGANDELRRGAPRYAPAVRFAVVHHTAGTNAYRPEESAAIVRGIELFHVKANGWNDIGYNFLVDRYGQVFEGRFGGLARNVVGAHSAGFNTGSVGVAVIGTYGSRPVSEAAAAALARLLAWRLDVAHVDPMSTVTFASRGNAKYPPGMPVTLRAISGHRDTAFTECPGGAFYRQLPAIVQGVAATGLPKLYEPTVRGVLGGLVSFNARLSSPQAWTVTVRDVTGAPVATGAGTGTAVRWTWNAALARDPSYTWSIEAGPSVRPARGTIGTRAPIGQPPALPPVLSEFRLTPGVISPDGDGYADATTVSYRLLRAAFVTATVLDDAATPVLTLFKDQRQSARVQSWQWTGETVRDGRYTLEVAALGLDGKVVRARAPILVTRALGFLRAEPPVFSPNGDGKLDTVMFLFDLGIAATVSVRVLQYNREVALVYSGSLQPGPQSFVWNGQTAAGAAPDGQYDLVVTASDATVTTIQRVRFSIDSAAQ